MAALRWRGRFEPAGDHSKCCALPAPAIFTPLWSGQAAALGAEMPAGALMQKLAREAR
jgi:hypothetical protein